VNAQFRCGGFPDPGKNFTISAYLQDLIRTLFSQELKTSGYFTVFSSLQDLLELL
jgi:hypothetical protein